MLTALSWHRAASGRDAEQGERLSPLRRNKASFSCVVLRPIKLSFQCHPCLQARCSVSVCILDKCPYFITRCYVLDCTSHLKEAKYSQSHIYRGCLLRQFLHGSKNPVLSLWDFRFSRRRVWSTESSAMYCRVLNSMSTDVSEVRAASIIRAMTRRTRQYVPEDSELQF
jgi:hypothetical protein